MVMCMILLSACSKQGKSYDKSVSKNDTITQNRNGNINAERLKKFIANVDKGKVDRINLNRYTMEGDPIITQLYFNGKDIEMAQDNSKDKFGGQDKDDIYYYTFKGGKQLKENLLKYLKENGF